MYQSGNYERTTTNDERSTGWALIFDLDGVVIDSMPAHTEAWRVYLEGLGIECEGIEPRMHGRRNDEIVADFIGPSLTAEAIFAHGAAKETALSRPHEAPTSRAHLVPGVVEFLRSCGGSPLGLASNAEPANIDFVLDGAGLRQWFQFIVDGHPGRSAEAVPGHLSPRRPPAGRRAFRMHHLRRLSTPTTLAPADLSAVDLVIRDFNDPSLKVWLESVERRT